MTSVRPNLIAMLERVADGGDVTAHELDKAIPNPLVLDEREKAAWEELSHWADDDDIRAKNTKYAASKREWMRGHLSTLRDIDWHPQPPSSHQRIKVGIWLALFLFSGASYQLGWGIFGGYDKQVSVALLFIGLWIMLPMLGSLKRH
ncbi:hypothetical protein N5J77_04665 [Sphingobium yanoikuyae]|uniref:Uncharacterized protein n=1 Tax=Sphingobium yanoikuyae TaxID=13690 RepID=A0AA43BB23_SPHYA|nr:hypothetical protein [Sphingobium yanoikuyae]MDH2130407.1 hypothetical protein [Sphingobium yanoikuyae]MDH2148250.1 hypothetical protein [Sphingobium yanoikuyae]MDH2165850.1 hypothetical protein [Sphingobium yanoikuyae]